MKKILLCIFFGLVVTVTDAQLKIFIITKDKLHDKIKGGWAGQTIGVTFGGPYEFVFNGTFIGDYQPLKWNDGLIKENMIQVPGLFDDLYMDLTFVDVFEKYGMSAPLDSFANAFANAGYLLWHANQAARYNVLQGIKAPESGFWKNNPHADCIDYQIESDFAGLMSPGMPNTASAISDKIGHIMNYGDGWYGGVYMGAMYTLAFISDDMNFVVENALKTIPPQSNFYKCINDVIKWHKKYPTDWKSTWMEVQKKWTDDISCTDGVFSPVNIDATVNAAYVVIGLLYGNKDYTKTLEITTRCGQDADCNPSSAGGILGTMLGYNNIPAYWKMGLKEAEGIDFKYTTMNLLGVYEIGLKHALRNIELQGGKITGNNVFIKTQIPKPVKYERSFEGMYPAEKKQVNWSEEKSEANFTFSGTGFILKAPSYTVETPTSIAFKTDLYVDEVLVETPVLPVSFLTRRSDLCWKYDLSNGPHTVRLKFLNPSKGFSFKDMVAITYVNKPVKGIYAHPYTPAK